MYTAKNVRFKIIFHFAWKSVLFFFAYALAITSLYELAEYKFIGLPFLPIGLIGTAVAFYLGFKNNSSYERLWEARKIWGNIVNLSRTFGTFVLGYVTPPDLENDPEKLRKIQKELIYRHLAFVHALRIRLRSRSTWESGNRDSETIVENQTNFKYESDFGDASRFLSAAENKKIFHNINPVTHILKEQGRQFMLLRQQGYIEALPHIEFGKIIAGLYDQQGACERIKSFPFPRQYAYFSKVFVWLFILTLPLGLVGEFAKPGPLYVWLTVPFFVMIAWVFNTMEIVGDTSENPFDNGINDIPMTAISRTIEIDLRQLLDEHDIPAPVTSVNNILM